MKRRQLARRVRDEAGVVAILVAALALLIMMFAAYAVDIGMQVNRKHQLEDTLDAAAQAGAYELPGSTTTALNAALTFASAHDTTETGTLAPNVDFWCVVASTLTSGIYQPDTTQIPATCNPGTAPYTPNANYKATGRKVSCSAVICAIPCVEPVPNTATPKITCNTIRVYQGRDVPFAFGPAGGIMKGSTGNLISVACRGSCGTVAPNPLDVAVIADRTRSMSSTDVSDMTDGIKGMLQQMTPSQQYVALGAIGRSDPTTTGQSGTCNSTSKGLTYPSDVGNSGKWLPISFSNNYVDANQVLQTGSALVKGVSCINTQSDPAQGTSLASPMKAAARYLLGYDTNNLSSLPARDSPAQKVLIFETDGQPNETENTSGSTSLTSSPDVFSDRMSATGPVNSTQADTSSSYNGVTTKTHHKTITYTYNGGTNACNNMLNVAANAKAANILVIMIAYNMTGNQCDDYDGADRSRQSSTVTTDGPEANTYWTRYETDTTTQYVQPATTADVLSIMAASASPANGVSSTANSDCSSSAERTAENGDGDYFFCAATGTDMAPIFKTALSQASKGIKLIRIP